MKKIVIVTLSLMFNLNAAHAGSLCFKYLNKKHPESHGKKTVGLLSWHGMDFLFNFDLKNPYGRKEGFVADTKKGGTFKGRYTTVDDSYPAILEIGEEKLTLIGVDL
ncbi:MAG TPA: hypothetical protein VN132_10645, partial [Bdellovibrio sp.]|nr:hypothetical protein [Bdellovibrio sp.]